MKQCLSLLAICLLFTACTSPVPGEAESNAVSAVTLPASDGETETIEYMSEKHPYGSGNDSGYYYLTNLEDGHSLIRYIDFETRQDIPLCSQPNCTHSDEKCPAWIHYGGTTVNVFATNDRLFICFNGSPWDSWVYETYGEQALPRVLTCALDGSGRKELVRFDASDAFSTMPATDGRVFYTIVTSYDNAQEDPKVEIVAVDLASGNKSAYDVVQRREPSIIGANGRELILESPGVSGLTVYDAYHVDTRQLRSLYNGDQPVSACCQDGVLYLLETDTGVIRQISLEDGEETTIFTDLLNNNRLSWMQLAAVSKKGYIVQAKTDEGYCNFLVDLSGKATKQQLYAESSDPRDKMRMLNVFAQQGEKYLVSPSRTFHTVRMPGLDGVSYGIDEINYTFALISQEDFWSSTPNYLAVSKLQ